MAWCAVFRAGTKEFIINILSIMPVAICNICETLVPYFNKRGAMIKDSRCKCGSNDLSAVGGRWNDVKCGWDYYDRRGNFKKFVPQDIKQFEPVK